MTYRVIAITPIITSLGRYSSGQVVVAPVPVVIRRDRGRPRIYDGPTLPVSFRVPAGWRVAGSNKRRRHKFNLTKLLAIHYRNFLTQPIEEIEAFIRAWEDENGSIDIPDE
jgi:hypothetical protein